jgi:glycosyltransferase involved in cell wall biosynthesis
MSAPEPVLFIAWTRSSGRGSDLASAHGGEAALIYPRIPLLRGPVSTMARYLVSALRTAALLARRRPGAVIVTNPPLMPAVVVALWALMTRRPFVLDSHPSGFGLKGKAVLAKLQPVHAVLARRARAVLVTTEEFVARVNGWGGRGLVVHEAPVEFPARRRPSEPVVLFVGVYASDEPVDVVVEAARLLPEVSFRITGDLDRAPAGLAESLPPNIELVGYLRGADYLQEVVTSSLVLTLTTEPNSIMRSGYEAVYAGVPLVLTDTPALRETFPFGFFCANTGTAVAAAIQDCLAAGADAGGPEEAVALQRARWAEQLSALREACGA